MCAGLLGVEVLAHVTRVGLILQLLTVQNERAINSGEVIYGACDVEKPQELLVLQHSSFTAVGELVRSNIDL